MTYYTSIVKIDDKIFVKYRKISNLLKFEKFICTKFPDFRFANVYNRETRQYIKTIKNPLKS